MNKEKIEELAFKDRKELANLNELDLLEIIEFLQLDRKQWINQYSAVHNDYVDLQQENQKYKEVIFKIKMIISARIKKYQQKIDNEIDMGSKGDHFKICRYEENIKFLKDILKEVE